MVGLKQGSTLKSGKYKIVKILGQGSFGITYLAQTRISMDGQLGKMDVNVNVTIKEFFMSDLNSRSSDGTNVERTSSTLVKNYLNKFRREAENLAKLHHPNIVKVLEVFDENNTTYYVMEYVDGETIDEYIKSKRYLSESESLNITQDVCAALSYMHEHKMLHLDLKPKNIMRNSEGHIFLIDFGLAKQYTEDGEPESSTSLGLGTPGYAPIEQAHYKQDGTFPVTLDVYAVGASLYKMLTGKTPPESSCILNDGLPHEAFTRAGVNENVLAIVEKAMSPIKKDRYQTITDLSKAISMLLSSNNEQTEIKEDVEETTFELGSRKKGETIYHSIITEENDEEQKEYAFEDEELSFFEKYWKYGLVGAVVLLCIYFCSNWNSSSSISPNNSHYVDSVATDNFIEDTANQVLPPNETITKTVTKVMKDGITHKQEKVNQQNESKYVEPQNNLTDNKSANSVPSYESKASTVVTTKVYDVVEQMPSFPGGQAALFDFLSKNIHYPVVAEENGIQGRVIVTFVVECDGSITDVRVVKSVDPSLDKEAVRVTKSMPRWNPGKHNGSAVRVKFTVPVTFRLQ